MERWIGGASAILAGLLVLVVLLAWLGRRVSRHESELKDWWGRLRARRAAQRAHRRLQPVIAFLRARLTPGGTFGLSLTLGVVILVGAAWLFGVIAHDVLAGNPLTAVDRDVAIWLHHHASSPFTAAMLAVSGMGSAPVISALVTLAALVLVWRRSWRRLVALILVVPGGALLNEVMKLAFHRPRPSFEHPLVLLSSYSFPSGHTAAASLFYGLMAVFAARAVRRWSRRVLVVLGATLLVLLIAFSRLYLGAHYLSDVLAALAEGVAWLSLCLTGLETLHRRGIG